METKPSRFAALLDDCPDPVKSVSKKSDKTKKKATDKNKTTGNGSASANSKNKPSAKNKQTLKSMAFGGSGDSKKKPLVPVPINQIPGTSGLGGVSNPKPTVQWEEWQRRDNEVSVEDYEAQLEAALVESRLEFEKDQALRSQNQVKSKSKKKPVAVSLNEFNATLTQIPKSNFNKNGGFPNGDHLKNGNIEDLDEEFMEKLRLDAKHEIDREKHLTIERELIKNRQSEAIHQNARSKTTPKPVVIDPKEDEIERLKSENDQLHTEVESYKSRLKKVYDIFQQAQELKDKAKLLCEVDNLKKLNEDLQGENQALHLQLEQERSKSHAAVNECRKLMEHSRRRTNTEASQ